MEELLPLHTSRPKRILVVDDDRLLLRIFGAVLKLAGYEAVLAGSAREAMDRFNAEEFDLITLDYSMPGMDGSKLLFVLSKGFGYGKRVSMLLPRRIPPVLVITGRARDVDVRQLLGAESVIDILEKPVRFDRIVHLISRLIDQEEARRAHRQKLVERLGSHIVSQSAR
jgi:CheY-like chemotaxis protein